MQQGQIANTAEYLETAVWVLPKLLGLRILNKWSDL